MQITSGRDETAELREIVREANREVESLSRSRKQETKKTPPGKARNLFNRRLQVLMQKTARALNVPLELKSNTGGSCRKEVDPMRLSQRKKAIFVHRHSAQDQNRHLVGGSR